MKFERIDDKTVKCYISMEEMQEYDITYKDFVIRSEKAKEIVEEIIIRATEEVGYRPPQFALDLQIMMMPEQGMVLTFSEKMPDDIAKNPSVLEYLKEMKKLMDSGRFGDGKKREDGYEDSLLPEVDTEGRAQQAKVQPDYAVFAFSTMRDICNYVNRLPKTLRVKSCLYEEKGVYYLYVEKGGASYARYSRACILALEYGTLYGASIDKLVYLDEHANCLLPEKAIQKMRL